MDSVIINPKQFIEEVKEWTLGAHVKIKARSMVIGDTYYFRFVKPNTGEVIETKIKKEDYEGFDFMELAGIIVPGVWEVESNKDIIKKLEEVNAKLAINFRRDRKGFELEFA